MLLSKPTIRDWEWLGRIPALKMQLLFVIYFNSEGHILCRLGIWRAKHLPLGRSKLTFRQAKEEETVPLFPTCNSVSCPP